MRISGKLVFAIENIWRYIRAVQSTGGEEAPVMTADLVAAA
jgi:hypothetical protein